MIDSVMRALREFRRDGRPDWVATSIALFTASTILASVTVAGYIAIGVAILDGRVVKPDVLLVRLGTIPAVFILSTYFVAIISSLSIIFHQLDALREIALKRTAIALYFQVVFTIIFALVTIFGGMSLYGNDDSSRQPRIKSAKYDSTNDEVVLAWEIDIDTDVLAFRIDRRASNGAADGIHENLMKPLPDKGQMRDNRPTVGRGARTYFDSQPPAAWLISYTVWAVYPDGSEIASKPFMAKMNGRMVRALVANAGNYDRFVVNWLDDGGTQNESACVNGREVYKIYLKTTTDGMAEWVQLSSVNPGRSHGTYEFTAENAASRGNEFTVRVMCGGTNPTTGVLIGEDNALVR